MPKSFHAEYYQSILQLRPANDELINFVESQVEKEKNVWISKKLITRNGVDYYLSSYKFARALGKKLKKSFRGELIESKKLFGRERQSSKLRYRGTVCFRLQKAL